MMSREQEKTYLMVGLILASLFIGFMVFYISCQQEWCCGVHRRRTKYQHEDDDVLAEMNDPEKGGIKVHTKTFNDSQRIGRLNEDDISDVMHQAEGGVRASRVSDTTGNTSKQSAEEHEQEKHIAVLATAPRCVLCSTSFAIGEDVTHSSHESCNHEFHELCLRKYWKECKNVLLKGKCPICKETYVVEKVAPSVHFTASSPLGVGDNAPTPTAME